MSVVPIYRSLRFSQRRWAGSLRQTLAKTTNFCFAKIRLREEPATKRSSPPVFANSRKRFLDRLATRRCGVVVPLSLHSSRKRKGRILAKPKSVLIYNLKFKIYNFLLSLRISFKTILFVGLSFLLVPVFVGSNLGVALGRAK